MWNFDLQDMITDLTCLKNKWKFDWPLFGTKSIAVSKSFELKLLA